MIAALQLALGLLVTAGSGLLLRSFERLHDQRPGFDAGNVTTFWMQLPIVRYNNDSAIVRFYSRLTTRVGELPGVRRAGLSSQLPLGGGGDQNPGGRVARDVAPTPLYAVEDK